VEKIKRFVVLPLGLFIINLVLALYRNPWSSFFSNRLDFWQKTGYFLRGLSACALYIFLIALLFTFVFTRVRVSELFKKPALKVMGIVFVVELMARPLTDIIMQQIDRSTLEAAKRGVNLGGWYSIPISLVMPLIHFAVLYLTLRLLLKPLKLDFTARKPVLFGTLLIYTFIVLINSSFVTWLIKYLYTGSFTMLGVPVRIDGLTAFLLVCSVLISMVLDLLIFEYFRWCLKDSVETVPIQNSSNN
jgi:hypothetical protein